MEWSERSIVMSRPSLTCSATLLSSKILLVYLAADYRRPRQLRTDGPVTLTLRHR